MICQRSCRQLRAEIDSRSKTRNRSPKTRYSLTHKSDRWQEVTCEVPDTCDICSQVLHCTVLKKILPAFCYGTNTPKAFLSLLWAKPPLHEQSGSSVLHSVCMNRVGAKLEISGGAKRLNRAVHVYLNSVPDAGNHY